MLCCRRGACKSGGVGRWSHCYSWRRCDGLSVCASCRCRCGCGRRLSPRLRGSVGCNTARSAEVRAADREWVQLHTYDSKTLNQVGLGIDARHRQAHAYAGSIRDNSALQGHASRPLIPALGCSRRVLRMTVVGAVPRNNWLCHERRRRREGLRLRLPPLDLRRPGCTFQSNIPRRWAPLSSWGPGSGGMDPQKRRTCPSTAVRKKSRVSSTLRPKREAQAGEDGPCDFCAS